MHELSIRVPARLREVTLVDRAAQLAEEHKALMERQQDEERTAVQRMLTRLTEVAEQLQAQQIQRLQEMQQVAVEIALAVASRLVHERLEAGGCAVEALVRQAVARLKTSQPVTIFLHPRDLELLEQRVGKAGPLTADGGPLRLVGDAALGRGDCRAESGDISLQANVQEQLAAIRRHLLETLPEATLDRRRPLPADRPFKRFPERRQTA